MPLQAGIEWGEVSAFRVPTAQQPHESDGTAIWDQTTVVLVKLRAAGQTGLGFSYTDAAATHTVRDLLAKDVVGRNAFDIPAIHSSMDRRVRNTGRPGLVSTAISAVDTCLWDLKARLLETSSVNLFGQMRESVPAYGSGGFTSYSEEQLVQQMTCWADEGLTAVKMKIGREPDQDVPRAAAVRKAIGDRVALFVDANGAYTRKQALRKAEQLAALNVAWFEEPVSSDDRHGLHLMVERAPACMDIAAGEYNYTLDDARLLAEAGAVDVMQADVTRCGGPTTFLKIAAYCEMVHLPFSAHTSPTVHATLCCSLVPAINVEYFFDHVRIEGMFLEGAIRAQGGVLKPDPAAPGFGFEWKEADAEPFRIARQEVTAGSA